MRDGNGRFVKGIHSSPLTEFKKGSLVNSGRRHTEETKKKISLKKKGQKGYWTGRLRSKETKEKISRANFERFANKEDHPRWKNGISQDRTHYAREYRNRKLGATGQHTSGEWEKLKAQYNWTCPSCRLSEPLIILTEDHIIPLTKGGSDNIENIQPLCRSCNSKKHTKTTKFVI